MIGILDITLENLPNIENSLSKGDKINDLTLETIFIIF
jgi:hypothetical protein